MRDVRLIPDDRLTESMRQALVSLAEPQRDEHPALIGRWIERLVSPVSHYFAVVDVQGARPVGLVVWSGPLYAVTPGWWIGVKGQGYGKAAARLLAHEMRRAGVNGIDGIVIDGIREEFMAASRRLAQELRKEFATVQGAAEQLEL